MAKNSRALSILLAGRLLPGNAMTLSEVTRRSRSGRAPAFLRRVTPELARSDGCRFATWCSPAQQMSADNGERTAPSIRCEPSSCRGLAELLDKAMRPLGASHCGSANVHAQSMILPQSGEGFTNLDLAQPRNKAFTEIDAWRKCPPSNGLQAVLGLIASSCSENCRLLSVPIPGD
jgi:hypothetical protein